MISKSGVHLPDTTYGGNPIAWKNADDSDEELRRLRAENVNLRDYIERKQHLQNFARIVDENSKLRELVRDMYKAFMHGNCYRWCEFKEPCNYISDGKCQWYDRMCELGAEVDG